jgi:hypothetical protein
VECPRFRLYSSGNAFKVFFYGMCDLMFALKVCFFGFAININRILEIDIAVYVVKWTHKQS